MAIRTNKNEVLSKFGFRLWALMEPKDYNTPRKLATALFDNGLVKVNSKQNANNSQEEIRKNAIGSIEKKILRHLTSKEEESVVPGEFLLAYCKHFNCSADYLLGITEIKTDNQDIREICNLTGLTEAATLKLTKEKQEQNDSSYVHKCWSKLIDSDLFKVLPFDWHSAYNEAKECLKCKAALAAIPVILKDEDPSSIPYNLISNKEKDLTIASDGHYAAYYGMLYKLAQNITSELDTLIETQAKEDKIYEREKAQMLYQFQVILSSAKDEPAPPKPDGDDFHWNSHIII